MIQDSWPQLASGWLSTMTAPWTLPPESCSIDRAHAWHARWLEMSVRASPSVVIGQFTLWSWPELQLHQSVKASTAAVIDLIGKLPPRPTRTCPEYHEQGHLTFCGWRSFSR